MKNPLRKRLLRELKSEWGKYLVIFLLLTGTMGMVSGFLVAAESMIAAYNESFEKYNIEDGHFQVSRELNRAQEKAVEKLGIDLYRLFQTDIELQNGTTMRFFPQRQEVNMVDLMEGELPQAADEAAIDRMYAENNGIRIGDMLSDGTNSWRVCGYVALSDYSALFSNNNDSMFDSVKFGVGILTEEAVAGLEKRGVTYVYAWKYHRAPATEQEEAERSEKLMKALNQEAALQGYVPRYLNQAVCFTGDDMGSDSVMITYLLYIVIVILAFVFGVTISNTVSREAAVIGVLRASGYTRGELLRHYISMPLLVTLISALAGNVLGYTWFKDVAADIYYGSYSLPTYHTIWSLSAFVKTTVVPLLLMLVVNLWILSRKLKLSPLKFLRRDLSGKKSRKAIYLPYRISFFGRFRLRVILQNAGGYVILFVGILFANLILFFGMIFPSVLEHYEDTIGDHMLCNYQYLFQVPMEALDEEDHLGSLLALMKFSKNVETENPDAEKFSAYALKTLGDQYPAEDVTLYGIEPDSRYLPVEVSEGQIYISSAYGDKYHVKPGDTLVLEEPYEDTVYELQVDGIYDYEGAVNVYMGREQLNELFSLGKAYYSGYFSDTEITDIPEKYISTVIDLTEITKISRQLTVSMGGMMTMVEAFALLVFVILAYLLSKLILEKNAQSISMAKILGYSNGEICRLYILSTAIVVAVCLAVSLPLVTAAMEVLYYQVILQMISGWIPFYLDRMLLVKMFVLGAVCYCLVAVLEFYKVKKVPMEEALKNVE